MAEFFIGQIMLTGFPFAPRYFALCNGQLMSISQNQALFSLLGTTYGGDGVTTFALPDLRGRTPVGFGNSVDPAWQPAPYEQGAPGGVETVTLTPGQLPVHVHPCFGSQTAGASRNPNGNLYGANPNATNTYAPDTGAQVTLAASTITSTTPATPHENMQPFSVINYCIALSGIFPSRN